MQQRLAQLIGLEKNTFKRAKIGFLRLDFTQRTQWGRFPDPHRAINIYRILLKHNLGNGMILRSINDIEHLPKTHNHSILEAPAYIDLCPSSIQQILSGQLASHQEIPQLQAPYHQYE